MDVNMVHVHLAYQRLRTRFENLSAIVNLSGSENDLSSVKEQLEREEKDEEQSMQMGMVSSYCM